MAFYRGKHITSAQIFELAQDTEGVRIRDCDDPRYKFITLDHAPDMAFRVPLANRLGMIPRLFRRVWRHETVSKASILHHIQMIRDRNGQGQNPDMEFFFGDHRDNKPKTN